MCGYIVWGGVKDILFESQIVVVNLINEGNPKDSTSGTKGFQLVLLFQFGYGCMMRVV